MKGREWKSTVHDARRRWRLVHLYGYLSGKGTVALSQWAARVVCLSGPGDKMFASRHIEADLGDIYRCAPILRHCCLTADTVRLSLEAIHDSDWSSLFHAISRLSSSSDHWRRLVNAFWLLPLTLRESASSASLPEIPSSLKLQSSSMQPRESSLEGSLQSPLEAFDHPRRL